MQKSKLLTMAILAIVASSSRAFATDGTNDPGVCLSATMTFDDIEVGTEFIAEDEITQEFLEILTNTIKTRSDGQFGGTLNILPNATSEYNIEISNQYWPFYYVFNGETYTPGESIDVPSTLTDATISLVPTDEYGTNALKAINFVNTKTGAQTLPLLLLEYDTSSAIKILQIIYEGQDKTTGKPYIVGFKDLTGQTIKTILTDLKEATVYYDAEIKDFNLYSSSGFRGWVLTDSDSIEHDGKSAGSLRNESYVINNIVFAKQDINNAIDTIYLRSFTLNDTSTWTQKQSLKTAFAAECVAGTITECPETTEGASAPICILSVASDGGVSYTNGCCEGYRLIPKE